MKLTGLILGLVHLVFALLVCFEVLDGFKWGVPMMVLDFPCTLLLRVLETTHLRFEDAFFVLMIGLGTVWWYLIGACLEIAVQRLLLHRTAKQG